MCPTRLAGNAVVQLVPFIDYTLLELCRSTTGTAGPAKCSCCPAFYRSVVARNNQAHFLRGGGRI